MKTQLITQLIVIMTIIITVTDLVVYYRLKQNPEGFTLRNTILVIIVTLVPVWINIWYHVNKLLGS